MHGKPPANRRHASRPSGSMFVQGTMDQGQPGSCDQLEFPAAKELSSHPVLPSPIEFGDASPASLGPWSGGGPVRELRRAPDRDGAGDIGHRHAARPEATGNCNDWQSSRAARYAVARCRDASWPPHHRAVFCRHGSGAVMGSANSLQQCREVHHPLGAFGGVLEKPPVWGSTAERDLNGAQRGQWRC